MDRRAIIEAIKRYGYTLRYASDEVKNDRDVVLDAVRQNGSALRYASNRLKDNAMLALVPLTRDLLYISIRLQEQWDLL